MSWGELGLKALGWLLIAMGALLLVSGIYGSAQDGSLHFGTFVAAALATWGGVKLISRSPAASSPPAPSTSPPPIPPIPPPPPPGNSAQQ